MGSPGVSSLLSVAHAAIAELTPPPPRRSGAYSSATSWRGLFPVSDTEHTKLKELIHGAQARKSCSLPAPHSTELTPN